MTVLKPALRKLMLTTHVALSVGWFGSVASFLLLSIIGLVSRDVATVRSSYVAMDLIGQFVVIPFGLAALTSGLIEACTTPWGLMQHYWVITKLMLASVAVALLLLHQYSAVAVAARRVFASAPDAVPDVGQLGVQLVFNASLAVVALLTVLTLAIYKPRGLTPYGRRRQAHNLTGHAASTGGRPGLALLVVLVCTIVVVGAVVHLSGLHGHAH